MARKVNRETAFRRRVSALPRDVRDGANMWLSYVVEARRCAAAGMLGRAAWMLDGAAQCRRALPDLRAYRKES